jgi:hypothetical protein
MEEIDKQLLQYIKDNYTIKYSFSLTPKQATEELKVKETEEKKTPKQETDETVITKPKTRGRPSYYSMVEEFLSTLNGDSILLPELSEKLGIPTDKLGRLLPEFNYYYDEPTRLWHKRER